VLREVEQPRIRRIRRGRPVRCAAADDGAGDGGDLLRVQDRPSLFIESARPVGGVAELAAGDVFARNAIDGEEIPVPRTGGNQLARAAADLAVDENRRLRRIPVVHVAWRRLVVPRSVTTLD